jgi:Spy/CpxP family protein refolding chaperone
VPIPQTIYEKTDFNPAAALFSTAIFAQETNSISEQIELKYTAAIEGRTTEILKVLALSDTNQRQKVHDLIIAQYRALNTWHDENDAKVRAARADTNATAQIRASLKSLHDGFVSGLADNLTPEQIEKVKDKLTYGKVQFTFAGYLAQYPDLSAANRQKILDLLKQAREEAMDGGSAAQKTAVFTRYKGRINNFLSQQGIHPTKPKAAPATNSVAQ